MAFKKIETNTIDLKSKTEGTSYEGVYYDKRVIPSTMKGYKDSIIWLFKDSEDKQFGIWGFTNLNFQMDNVPLNKLCKITYKGKSKIKNAYGKYPYQAEVLVDDGSDYVPE